MWSQGCHRFRHGGLRGGDGDRPARQRRDRHRRRIAYRDAGHWRIIDRTLGLPAAAIGRCSSIAKDAVDRCHGLFQLRGRDLVEHHNATSGLPGGVAWSFRRDPEGRLWLGTDHCLARVIAGRWECLPGSGDRTVRSFVFPPQGGVFIGGAPADLLYIDAGGHPTSLRAADGAGDQRILALALGPEGDLWVGTRGGLFRLRGAVPVRSSASSFPACARTFARCHSPWSATRSGRVASKASWCSTTVRGTSSTSAPACASRR